jgi:hypothetical protein
MNSVEKRKICFPYQKSDSDSSVVQLLASSLYLPSYTAPSMIVNDILSVYLSVLNVRYETKTVLHFCRSRIPLLQSLKMTTSACIHRVALVK